MTIHDGHRKRLRERFRREGLENFTPHETLELLLFYAKARENVNPLAHRLLETFGTLKGVLEAPVDQLTAVEGVGEETASLIAMLVPMFRKYEESIFAGSITLHRFRDMADYCYALLAGLRQERFCVISVSPTMKVLGYRVVSEGTLTDVPAYPRLVVETALNHNAYGVILCHNHPSGDACASRQDVEMTRLVQSVLEPLSIVLVDHLVVADGRVSSMAQTGEIASPFVQPLLAEERAAIWMTGQGETKGNDRT